MAKDRELPAVAGKLAKTHPDIWKAYAALGKATAKSDPVERETLRVVELALAIGVSLEGAVHSHTRRALSEGVSPDTLAQVALLAIPTLGLPHAVQAAFQPGPRRPRRAVAVRAEPRRRRRRPSLRPRADRRSKR